MDSKEKTMITVQTVLNVPVALVWKYWTSPEDIVNWNNASADWHTPRAENDLRAGGKFSYRMEAKDGSMGFDFWGVYDRVVHHEQIHYTMGDGRKAEIDFSSVDGQTKIVESFEAEDMNSIDLQRTGWQSILDNFKKYAETL